MKTNVKQITTLAGVFTIQGYVIPPQFKCAKMPVILSNNDDSVKIVTIDQSVSVGENVYSPVIYQSCMNPEDIIIYPLEIIQHGNMIIFKDHYHSGKWLLNQEKVQIKAWYPKLKRQGCEPCSNCGRC